MPAKFNTISATLNATYPQHTSQGAPTYHFLQIVILGISAPSGALLVLSVPEKHCKFFGFTFEHEGTLQNYQEKKATYTIQNESQMVLSADLTLTCRK